MAKDLTLGHIDSLELLDLAGQYDPQTIYDIGANVGTWTLLARAVLPTAAIHAFEPLRKHAQALQTATWGMRYVSLHPVALGAQTARAPFFVTANSDASSFLAPTAVARSTWGDAIETKEHPTLPMVRLDDYVTAHTLPWPDLIKLDVQGYELEVLSGADEAMRSASTIITEVCTREYYEGQPLFGDVAAFMGARGFDLWAVSETTPTGQPLAWLDVLFKRRGR